VKKRIISMMVACLILLTMPIQASETTLQDDLKVNAQNQEDTKEKIDANEATVAQLREEIGKLDQDIEKVEKEVASIQKEITDTQAELEKIADELEKAIVEKEEQKVILQERLRVMYMYSDSSMLEILFSSKDFSDLVTKMDTVKTVADFDQEVFKKLEAMENEINAKKEEIEQKKANLIELKKKSETKMSGLNEVKVTRSNYVAELKANTDKLEAELNDLEDTSRNIESEINSIMAAKAKAAAEARAAAQAKEIQATSGQATSGQTTSGQTTSGQTTVSPSSDSGSTVVNTGQYRWPVPGNNSISSPYGYRMHPVLGIQKFHSGIDIPTGRRSGVNAIAVGNGEVIKSGNGGSYGNMVIVDLGTDRNGNGISAVYAHLARSYVSAGTRVSAGQAIGEVGTTGRSTGIHLHFEIRVNGSTTNPVGYVR